MMNIPSQRVKKLFEELQPKLIMCEYFLAYILHCGECKLLLWISVGEYYVSYQYIVEYYVSYQYIVDIVESDTYWH